MLPPGAPRGETHRAPRKNRTPVNALQVRRSAIELQGPRPNFKLVIRVSILEINSFLMTSKNLKYCWIFF